MSLKKTAIFNRVLQGKRPGLAVLVDPDKYDPELILLAERNGAACFFIGGSKLKRNNLTATVKDIRRRTSLPLILFPGDEKQVTHEADGILILSLVSGRNPEYLIGKQVKAARSVKLSGLATFPTAYLLIGEGKSSTTQKITKTKPIASGKRKLICDTALAAEQLGMGLIYLEAGSGAGKTVPAHLVKAVRNSVTVPLIVGGGIKNSSQIRDLIKAGASLIVIGNILEEDPQRIIELGKAFR